MCRSISRERLNYAGKILTCGGYLLSLLLSLMVCVPMAIHQEHFKGHCLLFSTGTWQEKDGQFLVDWASQAYCNYTIFVAVIAFLVSLAQFVRMCKHLKRGTDPGFFAMFVDFLVAAFMIVMSSVAGFFVSIGFSVWCDEMERRFETCADATVNDIDRKDDLDMTDFHRQMVICQYSIWGLIVGFIPALMISMSNALNHHWRENSKAEKSKERKSLINEYDGTVATSEGNFEPQQQQRGRRSRLTSGESGKRRGQPQGQDLNRAAAETDEIADAIAVERVEEQEDA